MLDDVELTAQLATRKESIGAILRNGEDIALTDVAWLMYGMVEDMGKIALLHTNCEARRSYADGNWWRKLVRDRLATVALTLVLLGVAYAVSGALSGGLKLP